MTASRTLTARSAWHAVPRHQVHRFAEIALAEAPALAEEIMGEIRREYPHLPVVLDDSGEPMALIGIRRAIEVFVRHLAQGDHSVGRPTVPPGVFQDFGRGEGLNGRSLDALQATYRMGVRMAWRRFAEIGQRLDIPRPPCTNSSTPATSTWTGWSTSRCGVTPRRRPGRRANGCGCSAG